MSNMNATKLGRAFRLGMAFARGAKYRKGIAQDDKWITVKPNGENAKGRPVLLGDNGEMSELIPLIKLNGYVRNILINYGIELEKAKLMTPLERLIQYAY